jgi:hypothetical protein
MVNRRVTEILFPPSRSSTSVFNPFSRQKAPDEHPIADSEFRPAGSIAIDLRSFGRH